MSAEHREISIETLSTPPLQIKPAALARRTAAVMIDSLILGLVWLMLSIGSGLSPMQVSLSADYSAIAVLVVLAFFYYFVMEGMFGATIGKRLLKLTVLQDDGERCSFGASLKRNLLRFLDWLPFLYILGATAIIISKDRQRIGDLLAGTIVTNAPQKDPNPPPAPFLFH